MPTAHGEGKMASNPAYAQPRVALTDASVVRISAVSPGEGDKFFETESSPAELLATSNLPVWLEPVFKKLAELLDLPPNWDSYGAKPVNPETAVYAINLLFDVMNDEMPAPSVVPTNRGGVQLEWHTTRGDLEIEIEAPYKVGAFFEDTPRGESWEENRVIDLGKLQGALTRLAQTELP